MSKLRFKIIGGTHSVFIFIFGSWEIRRYNKEKIIQIDEEKNWKGEL